MNKPVITYIGIGSNQADPVQQVLSVLPYLDQLPQTELLAHSGLYQSEAVSDTAQDDYINAVAKLGTGLEPFQLLLELQAIEHAFYRQRDPGHKDQPRTMDLDILLYENRFHRDSHLILPHPQMHERLFVLLPLQEIAADLYIAGLGSLEYLIQQAPAIRIKRLD